MSSTNSKHTNTSKMASSKHRKISKMSSSKPKNMPSYNFPEEILSEIFKRLPVKSVLRCRSVQKSWYHLIKTPIFITLHTNHHKKMITTHDDDNNNNNNDPKYLFCLNMRDHLLTVRFDDVQCQEYCTLKYPLDLPDHAWYAISNGLFCVACIFDDSGYRISQHRNVLSHGPKHLSWMFNRKRSYDPNIYMWNPLVQKYKTLPASPCLSFTSGETRWKALAFGFLADVNDYVVVHIVKPLCRSEADRHSVVIGVYSLNTNSWKKISHDYVSMYSINSNNAVFVNGAAFWIGKYEQIVMCFDTKTEILREIRLPERVFNPVIHPFGQSIACFNEGDECNHHLKMWVLKDDDPINEFYWENKMIGSLSENVRGKVLGVRNNGEPILSKLSNLISYDLDNHEEYDFADSCDHRTPFSYYDEGCRPPLVITPFVETLVWLDID